MTLNEHKPFFCIIVSLLSASALDVPRHDFPAQRWSEGVRNIDEAASHEAVEDVHLRRALGLEF